MILLPKLRRQVILEAIQAFLTRHGIYLRRLRLRPVRHARILLGLACLALLFALLLTQPQKAANSQPYLTYDKISAQPVEFLAEPPTSP